MKRVACTYDNGAVFQHFGHTAQFKLYEIDGGAVQSSTVVDTNGSGHGALAGFLQGLGVDTLICGGIGGGAKSALEQAGIDLYAGVTGGADDAVAALLGGTLLKRSEANCSHHDGFCGTHGCGGHEA